ncbi:MAG TPA: NPCBM/NEW2 domain-containing protein [Actinophytocola sp.]|nr:NPCBM/NEW2 domain-containing protein [Actinophytocola sp.]HEV2784668.1 NPCBM/NEW2 domain-containing protein [Actinophytocola sp.]
MTAVSTVATQVAMPAPAYALPDGLALTPPMGFNNWNTTHCSGTFNEQMIVGIADLFVEKGLKEAGYEFVNIDDCWALPARDPVSQRLVPDPARFPRGIKWLADYVHGKGLKFGIYTSAGTKTCNSLGFPGGLGFEELDARTFAEWGVDYLKYDNCNNQGVPALERYPKMRDALKATGRPIVYSITEWGQNRPWEWGADVGHLWRTTGDISDNFGSMLSIMKLNAPLAEFAGPGHWNDPDMLEVGNGGMTDTEYRSHFSLWAIMAAPLLIGSDLRRVSPATYDILLNREVIAVDQDPLGRQGRMLSNQDGLWTFAKPLANGDVAVALFNETSAPATISTTASAIGLPASPGYIMRDLWSHTAAETAGVIAAGVPSHGTAMFRVSADPRWGKLPAATSFAGSATTPAEGTAGRYIVPGKPVPVSATLINHGRKPVLLPRHAITLPDGWTATPTGPLEDWVLNTEERLAGGWTVTPAPNAPPGAHELTVTTAYREGSEIFSKSAVIRLVVPGVPPPATGFVSDARWLEAANGWGPVELDRSVGERPAGDGRVITIAGVQYAKGLGTHSPAAIMYFTAGRCASLVTDVGVDDEKRGNRAGSVTFEIWADGRKVADSGVLTWQDPARTLTADLTGASFVRLVVTDAGDGMNSDHADWAAARPGCPHETGRMGAGRDTAVARGDSPGGSRVVRDPGRADRDRRGRRQFRSRRRAYRCWRTSGSAVQLLHGRQQPDRAGRGDLPGAESGSERRHLARRVARRPARNRDHRPGLRHRARAHCAADRCRALGDNRFSLRLTVADARRLAAVRSAAAHRLAHYWLRVHLAAGLDHLHVRARRDQRLVSVPVPRRRDPRISGRAAKHRSCRPGRGRARADLQGARRAASHCGRAVTRPTGSTASPPPGRRTPSRRGSLARTPASCR